MSAVAALKRPVDQDIQARIDAHPPSLFAGDMLPDVTLTRYQADGDDGSVCYTRENFSTLDEAKKVKNVFIRTFPGAFTKVCETEDMKDFIEHLPQLQDKYGLIAVVTTDRTDVLRGWLKVLGIYGQVQPWADNMGEFTDTVGRGINMSGDRGHEMGIQRGAIVLENGKVTRIVFEEKASDYILTKASLFV